MIKIRIVLAIIFLSLFPLLAQGIDTLVTADQVISRYVNALGGAEKLERVTDRTTIMSGKMNELEIKITIYQKHPALMKQIMSAGEIERVLLYDGTKGVEFSPFGKRELEGFELTKLKMDADIHFFLHTGNYPVEITYTGIDTLNGEPAYNLEFKFDELNQWDQWFSVAEGYKIKESRIINFNNQDFEQVTYFSDYKEAGGLILPHTIEQQLGAQTFIFTLISADTNPIPLEVFNF